jgi:two-component system, OmpR family, sensor histidine kinase KdpD
MEQLYELGRSTLLINRHQAPGPQLTHLIRRIFSSSAVAMFDVNSGKCDIAGVWGDDERELAKECYLAQADDDERSTRTSRRLL